MTDSLKAISITASSALQAQSQRLQIVAENMANVDSTGETPGSDPYKRKSVVFEQMVDAATGASRVKVARVEEADGPFRMAYDPSNPAADATGYVKMPNVNAMIELANMRAASQSYQANLNMYQAGRDMRSNLIGMLES